MSDPMPTREELLANQHAIADLVHHAAAASPDKGWDAGQVCAHLIANNGLFIKAAEAVAAGEATSYDNESSLDDRSTAAFAAGAGSVGVLAGWLKQSATSLVDFLTTLSDEVLDTDVTTTLRSDGALLVDAQPRRLGDLMVGQLTFHSEMHLQQVQQLIPH
jgi:hypothetical protein